MPVPWMQIVQLMPAILDVSRDLLKRARREAPPPATPLPPNPSPLELRVVALEENERRQAQLVNDMAEQLAKLTAVATALHKQVRRLLISQTAALVIAIVAVLIALR